MDEVVVLAIDVDDRQRHGCLSSNDVQYIGQSMCRTGSTYTITVSVKYRTQTDGTLISDAIQANVEVTRNDNGALRTDNRSERAVNSPTSSVVTDCDPGR